MAAGNLVADYCKLWEKSGKSEFLKLCRSQNDSSFVSGKESRTLKHSLYELCWQVLKGNVKVEPAVSIISDICDNVKDLPSVLADIFAIIDTEIGALEDKNTREKYTLLISACDIIIPAPVLKERIDQEVLESIGLIPSKLQFQQKYVKTKTKLYYKQQKFNLLREESEGYAKLITELMQEITDEVTSKQSVENLKSLIGCFDLDPNRVLDTMLECFECRPHLSSFYIPIFKDYVTEQKTLCHILGFKFHFYQEEETPASLYKIAALLLQNNLIDLESLYPHLLPPDSKIKEYHQKDIDEAKAYARKLNVVSLSDKADDSKDGDAVKVDLYVTNQKLGLCEALLNLGAWQKAKEILDRLPEFFATVHKPIASAICSLVHVMMDPLYRQNSGLPKKVLKGRISSHSHGYKSVHRVKTYRELQSEVLPIMRYLGPYASCDPVLLVKIVRLGKSFMTKRQSGGISPDDDVAYYGFLNMLDELLLPSMSMLPFNCCLSEELWSLLKLYPYELRYRLYGNWKNDTYSHHPKLIRIRADCLERAKYLMKRLSKENVKPSGRQLGKLSHSNPGVLFEYVLSQIQRYDNFIGPVVDTLKYLTSLSYDILAYCIIEALANPEKDRMKHDDTNISLWLQSLANFAGSICRKYQVELAGLMQYVANQLKSGKSFDLLLLREIVTKMAGIEISEEITDDQLDAMSGGELLRQEGGYFAQVRNTKKSSTRLKDALLEHDLALSLCLLMAQQREGVIYKEGAESHLKLVGKLYDQCQDTLVQFGSFLSMQLSTEEFVKRLPSIDVLMTSYNVPADAAFFLCRPQYAYATNSKFEELRKIDKSNKQTGSQQKLIRYSEASEECMSPVIELVRPLYSARVWEDLSPQFYVTFWSLSMYDLAVPSNVYDKQIQQLTAQISATEDNKDLPQSKKKKEKERCSNLIDKLKDEMKKQGEHCNRVKERLKSQKEQWFISRSTKNETITQFLQLCIFPRCCFTASDAVYCAKFIHLLHDLKTPNFSTLICCDRIFCDITYTVTSCTENEAHRYGRFLCSTLNIIMKWHSSKEIYDKECAAYPGFVTVFRKGTDSVNKADQLDYENYRHVCHKWHFRITKAMVACLESGNYIQIRNALIVLTKLLPNYPRVFQFGQALERRVDRLRQEEKEKRPDIYALAMGYSGQLKGKKSTWVQENVFHQKETKGQKAASQASSKNDENAAKKNSESRGNSRKTENSENKSKDKEKEPKDKEKKSSEKKDKSESKSKLDIKKANGDKKEQINGTTKSSEKNKDREKEDKIIIKAEKMSKGYGDEKSSKESSKISKDKEEKSSNSQSKHSKEERKEIIADHIKEEKREEKLPRSKEEPRDRKEEKRDKEREKEEHRSEKSSRIKLDKHEKVKIKRILSPEKKESGDRDYKDQDAREHEREVTERANSVGSIESRGSGSHHRRSPDSSPKYVEERDSKRRKLESASSESKEKRDRSHSRERHRKSPSNERDREREKKDRKRLSYDAPDDRNELEVKRRKSVEPSPSHSSSKVNGDSDKYHSKKDKDSDKKSEKSDGSHGKIKLSKESHVSSDISPQRTKSKDKDRDREKSKNKDKSKSSSSSKKSKK